MISPLQQLTLLSHQAMFTKCVSSASSLLFNLHAMLQGFVLDGKWNVSISLCYKKSREASGIR